MTRHLFLRIILILQIVVLAAIGIAVAIAIVQNIEPPNFLIWVLAFYVAFQAIFVTAWHERELSDG